ncbi:MAG: protein translocase subunit SecF [Gemmatimonadales bacterium]
MIRLFANARYDFIGNRRWAYSITAAFVLPGLLWLAIRGITYSIEFTGGAFVQVRTTEVVGTRAIRDALRTAGLTGEVQEFGAPTEFALRVRLGTEGVAEGATEAVTAAVTRALDVGLGAGRYEILRTEAVSPKVGRELRERAVIAVLFSFLVTLVYLGFRFEWRFGLGAVLATAHDILATLAFIRYLDLEVSLVVVAAVLTVVGYSLNDTIVIFDRVRENLRKYRRQNLDDILNLSINETLPRTVLTGGTTIATALMLSFFAGEVIKPFALVLSFGIIVGTFSSIFVASPILLAIEKRWPGTDARGARVLRVGGEPAPAPPTGAPPAPGARPKARV